MNPANWMTSAIVAAMAAVAITAIGATSARVATRRSMPNGVAGGPYRTMRLPKSRRVDRPGEHLVAVGSTLLAATAAPAIVFALLTLKWEGIGVTLLPALLVVAARLHASLVTFRGGDLAAARTIAHASLLLDVPLLVFSIIHVRLEDGTASEALSLTVVAGAFALADGVQALLVLLVPPPSRAIRE